MKKEDIKVILEEIMSTGSISIDTKLSTIITDSLEMIETQMLIEDKFNVNIPVTFNLVTFGDFIDLVHASVNTPLTLEPN